RVRLERPGAGRRPQQPRRDGEDGQRAQGLVGRVTVARRSAPDCPPPRLDGARGGPGGHDRPSPGRRRHLAMRRFETYGAGAAEGPGPAAPPAEAKAASEAAPELTPGIPGLKMADVRDHRHLW